AIVKWSKVSGKTGYQVQYCCNSKFKGGCKITATASTSFKTPRLNCKRVYIRVRAYKRTGGKICYSPWSAVKSKSI
ncbi:MAG: hypothetical protein IJ725_05705, partial [Ruminococcus sp.]|nr:hypothetical protein [Ruminococcus sp.]